MFQNEINLNSVVFIFILCFYILLLPAAISTSLVNFNLNTKLKLLIIGTSPFLVVSVAYIFKILGILIIWNYLFIIFIIITLIINHKKINKIVFILRNNLFVVLIFSLYLIFFTFDARNHITEGGIDVLHSFGFVEQILSNAQTAYQPGLSLYISPVHYFFADIIDLGYLAGILGISIVFHSFLVLSAFNSQMAKFFLLILLLPFFYQLNILLIGLASTSWGVLILVAFLAMLINLSNHQLNFKYALTYVGIFSSVGLFTPTIFPYLIPLVFIVFFFDLLLGEKEAFIKFLIPATSLLLSSLIYILNTIFSNSEASSEISSMFVTSLRNQFNFFSISEDASLFIQLILDFFSFEDSIRPLNSVFDLFGWVIFLTYGIILIYSLIKKNRVGYITASFGFYFGLVTMVGIFEISYFKGRAGIYFLVIFSISLAYALSTLYNKYFGVYLLAGVTIVAFISGAMFPIKHYRYHDESIYFEVSDLILNGDILESSLVITDLPQMNLVSNRFKILNLNDFDKFKLQDQSQIIFILDFNEELIDPVYSRQFEFYEVYNTDIDSKIRGIRDQKIVESKLFEATIKDTYKLIFSDSKYKIYSN